MWLYLLGPAVLTAITAIVAYPSVSTRTTAPTRIAVGALFAAMLAAVLAFVVIFALLATPAVSRCGDTTFLDTVAGLSGWVVAVVGGIALAALRADARRQRGVIVWHLPAGLILVVLPYAVFVGLFYVALTCSS